MESVSLFIVLSQTRSHLDFYEVRLSERCGNGTSTHCEAPPYGVHSLNKSSQESDAIDGFMLTYKQVSVIKFIKTEKSQSFRDGFMKGYFVMKLPFSRCCCCCCCCSTKKGKKNVKLTSDLENKLK